MFILLDSTPGGIAKLVAWLLDYRTDRPQAAATVAGLVTTVVDGMELMIFR